MALTMNDLKKAVIARDVEIARLRAALERVATCGASFTLEELGRQSVQWRLGYHANITGQDRGDNPFSDEHEEDRWRDWDEGWCAGPNAIPPEDNPTPVGA